LIVLVLLFATALAIRLHGIDAYPLDISQEKQYRSALTARAYYYESAPSIPEWKREVARVNLERLGILVPPIMDKAASLAYRAARGEHLWIPRLVSTLFWLVGGIFVFLIGREIASSDAALISTGFYLLVPFGISASRSFQPDPVMVAVLVMALFGIIRFYKDDGWRRLVLAGALSSLAIFLKPVSGFFILGGFFSLAIYYRGWRKAFLTSKTFWFLTITLLPNVIFYGYGIFLAGFLRRQANASFFPSLFFDAYYWQFWLKHINSVVGFPAFIGGLLGLMLLPRDRRLFFVAGLWAGYVVYGLAFNYHIHTHPYYQLPLIPVVALSLGPAAALIIAEILKRDPRWPWRWAVWSTFSLAALLSVGLAIRDRQELPDFSEQVMLAEQIGEMVGHSTSSLLLAPYEGRPLKYHGHISGKGWPTRGDMDSEKLIGAPTRTAGQRVEDFLANEPFEFFIVTNFDQFAEQHDLKNYLRTKFPVFAEGESYLIFDLR
jgi:hypothetical protein